MEATLFLKVIEGKGLPPRDATGFSDPYCVLVVNGIKHDKTTKVVNQTNDPKFNQEFEINISNAHEVKYDKKGELIVELWDWDRMTPDDFIGRAIIPLAEITEKAQEHWSPLQGKPHFHEPVYGHILLRARIEFKVLPVHNLSSLTRINQKVGATFSQLSRVGVSYMNRKMGNVASWTLRCSTVWSKMKHMKPPHFSYCRELVEKFKRNTAFTMEELELLFYAFRSFSYPYEEINMDRFCKVFPALEANKAVVLALFTAFNLHPQDDITFDEFVVSLSNVTRGTQPHRLNMVSRFYDDNGTVYRDKFDILSKSIVNLLQGPQSEQELVALSNDIFGSEKSIPASKFLLALQRLDPPEKTPRSHKDGASEIVQPEDEEVNFGIGYCFGLFHYLCDASVDLLEQMVNGSTIQPEKEGFLMKKSGASWAKFWFCLRDGFIFYYRDPADDMPARVVFLEAQFSIDKVIDASALPSELSVGSIDYGTYRARSLSNTRRTTISSPSLFAAPRSPDLATLAPSSPALTVQPLSSPSSPPLPPSPAASASHEADAAAVAASCEFNAHENSTAAAAFVTAARTAVQAADVVSALEAARSATTASIQAAEFAARAASAASEALSSLTTQFPDMGSSSPSSPSLPSPSSPLALPSLTLSVPSGAAQAKPTTGGVVAVAGAAQELTVASQTSQRADAAKTAAHVAAASAAAAQAATSAAASAVTAWTLAMQAASASTMTAAELAEQQRSRSGTTGSRGTLRRAERLSGAPPVAPGAGQSQSPHHHYSEKTKEKLMVVLGLPKKLKHNNFKPGPENTFQFRTGDYSMALAAKNEKHKQMWMERLTAHANANANNPYGSFAPPREHCGAQFYVDGRDYYLAVADALTKAREQIFITDWFLSPEVYLRRSGETAHMTFRLDTLLQARARAGVKVYVIVWNETKLALNLNSERVKMVLEALDPNIAVICHPILMMKYSHHQKTVIVDQDMAFLGGLDMCFGRFDTSDHPLTDQLAHVYPGKDYYNPSRGGEFDGLELPFKDLVDRAKVPRMPWHDVSVRVDGYAARDVAKNFIQRWNHHRDQIQISSPLLIPKSTLWPYRDNKTCQVLRSLSDWSGQGCTKTEASIQAAMLAAIQQSKHFIYIENQYFISDTAGGKVKNEIATALLQRVRSAIIERRIRSLQFPHFRVVVVLPVHPEGTYKDSIAIRYIMKWQYDTICRGGRSILEVLQKEFPEENLNDYITFYALRNYGILQNQVVTEQIYVHTKLMIVDDKFVIVGSANINDRSLLGDRDSEIAVRIEDEELVPSKMAGQPYMAGKFALNLRMQLWREHLGLPQDDSKAIMDPVLPESYETLWRGTAKSNTALYTQVFGVLEGDTVASVRDIAHQQIPELTPDVQAALNQIRGHLVEYPLNFLSTGLAEAFDSLDILLAGDEVFQ